MIIKLFIKNCIVLHLLGGVMLHCGLCLATSSVSEPNPELGLRTCVGSPLYIKNHNVTISDATTGSLRAAYKGSASISITNPGNENDGYKTVLSMKFKAPGFVQSMHQLFRSAEYSGCDRLSYNNDATLTTHDDKWTIVGHFKYEERACTSIGSMTIANKTTSVRIYITPVFKLVKDGSNTKLIANVSSTYEIPSGFLYSLTGELFESKKIDKVIPGILAANIESSSFNIRDQDGGMFMNVEIVMRPQKKAFACWTKKTIGEAIWESGDWGRAY